MRGPAINFKISKSRTGSTDFLKKINGKNPVIEAGDISIYVLADNFTFSDEKIALLADDTGITNRYICHPRVLVLDYQSVILNSL